MSPRPSTQRPRALERSFHLVAPSPWRTGGLVIATSGVLLLAGAAVSITTKLLFLLYAVAGVAIVGGFYLSAKHHKPRKEMLTIDHRGVRRGDRGLTIDAALALAPYVDDKPALEWMLRLRAYIDTRADLSDAMAEAIEVASSLDVQALEQLPFAVHHDGATWTLVWSAEEACVAASAADAGGSWYLIGSLQDVPFAVGALRARSVELRLVDRDARLAEFRATAHVRLDLQGLDLAERGFGDEVRVELARRLAQREGAPTASLAYRGRRGELYEVLAATCSELAFVCPAAIDREDDALVRAHWAIWLRFRHAAGPTQTYELLRRGTDDALARLGTDVRVALLADLRALLRHADDTLTVSFREGER